MEMTSAEANKLLRKLREEHDTLTRMESENYTFEAATTEDPEDVRPDYDYRQTQLRLEELERRICRLKHAVNRFNVTQEVSGTGMTIDQVLVRIPQLSDRKRRLAKMRTTQKKTRNYNGRGVCFIDYSYANFDPAEANRDYLAAADELAALQNALDLVNSTVRFEADTEEQAE